MRLALNIDSLTPQLSGIGRYTLNLCTYLSRHPEVVDLAYFRNQRWLKDYAPFLIEEAPHIRNPLRSWKRLARWRSRREFDRRLLHGPNFFLPEGAQRGVITVHDLSVFLFPETHPEERRRYFDEHFPSSLRRARHIITDSQTVKTELCERFGVDVTAVTAIPLGVSPDFGPHNRSIAARAVLEGFGLQSGGYCLSVATLEPRKKLVNAIRAFLLATERGDISVPFVLAGASGWHNEEIHDLINRAGGKIRFLGYVPEAQLPILYANAAIFLYPSIYEGFGLPPVEAMASGVPVIAANRSCLPEITRGAALMIDPDDIDGFAGAIRAGLLDSDLRGRIIADGRRVAAGYSWELCVERTLGVYRRVMAA
ncbi:glycosyltransferase family 1 protein [Sphingobium sp. EM0848]|uniref:glycosyltransferase family 4 protein n=1 Tax=Sphingobium sp. EM0848 TaxID=2743473 RepID=UPI00159C3B50|nr:glycosyltransferase family 1 protein [Sphingobium sp. EM0848]